MDPSALIFILLAVAWAIYLIPKALEHHEESIRTRTVEKFSSSMRVLGRREPINRRKARLVRTPKAARDAAPVVAVDSVGSTVGSTAAEPMVAAAAAPVRRSAAARAARRRLRVVTAILLTVAVVAALVVASIVAWVWVLAPVALLAAWLVACRLMVKRERGAVQVRVRTTRPGAAPDVAFRRPQAGVTDDASADETDSVPAAADEVFEHGSNDRPDPTDPRSWDPVPVTLPTYVSKPVAQRSVRTIDLDDTGVWSSGRSESDSELVRESSARDAQAERAAKADDRSAERRRRA